MPDASTAEAQPRGGFLPIAIVYSMPEATVLLTTLAAYGISAIALNRATISAVPSWMLLLGGITIAVAPAQIDDALALLDEIDCGWSCPPPPFAVEPWLSRAVSIGLTWFCSAVPPPRLEGSYRWRKGSAEPPSSA